MDGCAGPGEGPCGGPSEGPGEGSGEGPGKGSGGGPGKRCQELPLSEEKNEKWMSTAISKNLKMNHIRSANDSSRTCIFCARSNRHLP